MSAFYCIFGKISSTQYDPIPESDPSLFTFSVEIDEHGAVERAEWVGPADELAGHLCASASAVVDRHGVGIPARHVHALSVRRVIPFHEMVVEHEPLVCLVI